MRCALLKHKQTKARKRHASHIRRQSEIERIKFNILLRAGNTEAWTRDLEMSAKYLLTLVHTNKWDVSDIFIQY